jgi:hypothetical protein
MTSVPQIHPLAAPAVALADDSAPDHPAHDLRLRLKPKALPTGYVDGGWWPRSRDLSIELEALVHVLDVRLGKVTRVAFALDGWETAPRRITVDGHAVRLEGFHSQDEHMVHVSGSDRQRMSLLVVPPDAEAAAAHDAMMTASARGNADRPIEILATGGVLPDTTGPRLRLVEDEATSRTAQGHTS